MTADEIKKNAVRAEILKSTKKVEGYFYKPAEQQPIFLLFYIAFLIFAIFKILGK